MHVSMAYDIPAHAIYHLNDEAGTKNKRTLASRKQFRTGSADILRKHEMLDNVENAVVAVSGRWRNPV